MTRTTFLSHTDVGKVLARLQLGVAASELHGSIIGYLCASGAIDAVHDWLQALQLEPARAEDTDLSRRLLAELAAQGRERLEDPGMGFVPMLPPEKVAVGERARALVAWCRGFLGGLGLAGVDRKLPAAAAEVVRDVERIAAARERFDGEDDEAALTELVEYVRVGALLLREELRAPSTPDQAPMQ